MDSKTQKVFKRTHISSSTEIQELDRKDGEEKITEANREARIRHDVRREAENIPRHQTAPQKGSDCVKMRGSRAAQVCLVLLCAALLTVVIVLAVSLHNMIEEFYIKNKSFTDEIDHLKKEKSKLETLNGTKQQLQKDIQNLEKLKQSMDGWTCYQSNLYFISSEEKSWTESRSYCTERGADLIIINNKQEQDFVKSISNDQSFWIGLNDRVVEGSWKWNDGTNVTSGFRFWKNGQPGSYRANDEDCAATDSSGWTAYQCNRAIKWICERSFEKQRVT